MIYSVILTLGVIFVNGWTDAPNAITGCVCSGALSMKKAVFLAAFCNFFGVLISCLLFPTVAKNIFETAGISGSALQASLLSVIIMAVGAWWFGIPTSESHAIIASISGAAVAVGKNMSVRLLLMTAAGLVISVLGGFIAGYFTYGFLYKKKIKRWYEIVGAGLMAFMHGAQDGQKFISILLLASGVSGAFKIPISTVILCSAVMTLGTAVGGGRIIEKVGREMVTTDGATSVSADIAGGISIFLSTVMGLPVSTTHAKTAAVMGCGYMQKSINKKTMRQMITAWLITFPVCFILGFIFTKLF